MKLVDNLKSFVSTIYPVAAISSPLFEVIELAEKEEQKELEQARKQMNRKFHYIISPREGYIQFVAHPTTDAIQARSYVDRVERGIQEVSKHIQDTWGEEKEYR